MAKFRGDPCKTSSCAGHRAGFAYASGGGTQFAPRGNRSFNNGMRIAMGWKIPKPRRK